MAGSDNPRRQRAGSGESITKAGGSITEPPGKKATGKTTSSKVATGRAASPKAAARKAAAAKERATQNGAASAHLRPAITDARPTVVLPGRPEKKAEILARHILDDILSNGLAAGTPLPNESAMMSQYGAGRITLREALRILEVQGILTIRPGSSGGPVVTQATSRDYGRMSALFFRVAGARLVDLMEARNLMEATAARLAAAHRDPAGVETLEAIVEQLRNRQEDEESNAVFLSTSRQFHDVVNAMSGNVILDLMTSALVHMFIDRMAGFVYPVDKRSEANAQHLGIALAILDGDGEAAERLMREHMAQYSGYARQGWSGALSQVISWR